jgi:N-acetylneuraminic acid mutarotase
MVTDVKSGNRYFPVTVSLVLILLSIPILLNIRLNNSDKDRTYRWMPATAFQQPRRALAAAGSGNHIYVIGGINDKDEYVRSVEFTTINSDGSLEPWRKTSSLIEARFYHAAVSVNGYLYTLGGAIGARGNENIPIASVERAKILGDGSLGPWRAENYLTTPRRGTKAVAYGQHIYAIGGYNGEFLRSIERADINDDGSLSQWKLENEQANIDRYIHSATIFGDNIYLLGGHVHDDNKVSYGDVEMSHITRDGSLSPWEIEQTILREPRFIASAFAMNNYIYILGGHNGATRLNSVEVAALTTAGHVDSWEYTATLPSGRDGTAVVTQDNYIYVLGGIDDNNVLNTVDMIEQAADGQLGIVN